jgi:hypothetical protein
MKIQLGSLARKSAAMLAAGVVAGVLALHPVSAQTTLAEFQFNEGTGKTTASPTNTLVGYLGGVPNPNAIPVSTNDSPSGLTGDLAVALSSSAFLVVDDATSPLLAPGTTPLTIEGWIKHSSAAPLANQGILAYGGSYKLGLASGQLVFTLFGVVDIFSGYFPAADEWHHVAAVWEPGVGVTFYLDGAAAFIEETRAARPVSNNLLNLGAERLGNALEGTIDRLRVHGAALTIEQLDTVAAEPKAILPTTLVAYAFNETTGPWQNSAPALRPTIVGATFLGERISPAWSPDSPTGSPTDSSLHFTTGGMRVVVPDPNTAIRFPEGHFTIQAWVKFGAQPDFRSVFFFNNGPGGAVSFSIANRRLFVTTLGIVDQPTAALIPDDGGWHHVAVIHEAGVGFRFFVDGILGDTIAYTRSLLIDVRTATEFVIGSEPSGGLPYVGKLDRLIITSGLLDPKNLDFRPIPGIDPDAPSLSIRTVIEVSWPSLPAGYLLQTTATPELAASWTFVTGTPTAAEGTFRFYAPVGDAVAFYRLIKPAN